MEEGVSKPVNIHEAKTHLSRLLEQAAAGREVVIANRCGHVGALRRQVAMRLLLDTHVLLWALSEPNRIGKEGPVLIDRAEVYVSPAFLWEIGIKSAQRNLMIRPDAVLIAIEPTGFSMFPIAGEQVVRVFDLNMYHDDPFDQMLLAQAQMESMSLLTNDKTLAAYGCSVRVLFLADPSAVFSNRRNRHLPT